MFIVPSCCVSVYVVMNTGCNRYFNEVYFFHIKWKTTQHARQHRRIFQSKWIVNFTIVRLLLIFTPKKVDVTKPRKEIKRTNNANKLFACQSQVSMYTKFWNEFHFFFFSSICFRLLLYQATRNRQKKIRNNKTNWHAHQKKVHDKIRRKIETRFPFVVSVVPNRLPVVGTPFIFWNLIERVCAHDWRRQFDFNLLQFYVSFSSFYCNWSHFIFSSSISRIDFFSLLSFLVGK